VKSIADAIEETVASYNSKNDIGACMGDNVSTSERRPEGACQGVVEPIPGALYAHIINLVVRELLKLFDRFCGKPLG
jgi:hypothetical protein